LWARTLNVRRTSTDDGRGRKEKVKEAMKIRREEEKERL
jgi:hypothetical protein